MKLMFGKNKYLKNQSKCVSPPPSSEVEGFKFACISCAFIILLCKCDILNLKNGAYSNCTAWGQTGIQLRIFRKDTLNVKTLSFFVGFEFCVTQWSIKKHKHKVVYHCSVNKTVFSKNKRTQILCLPAVKSQLCFL